MKPLEDLERIYRENADIVFRYLMSKTGSVDLSKELTQETFYQAVKCIDQYKGAGRISSWLCGIAKNVLYAHVRKEHKETPSAEDISRQFLSSAEDIVIKNEETRSIMEAIKAFPDPGGEILRLRLFGGLSFKQIGSILGHTENWARVNYYRAKQVMIKELNQDE